MKMPYKITLKGIFLSLIFSVSSAAEVIHFKTQDGFKLEAHYSAGSRKLAKGVLMLHQCNRNKDMYTSLGKKLASEGIHSLAVDLRGYGGSNNEAYEKQEAALDTSTREKLMTNYRSMMEKVWPLDVDAAYKTLAEKIDSDNIAFIGASCGGELAVTLAKKNPPKSFIFFSAGMASMTQTVEEHFKPVNHIPSMIIVAQDDGVNFKTANELFLNAKNEQSKLISYKGKEHGEPLFELDKHLENTMLAWLKQSLNEIE